MNNIWPVPQVKIGEGIISELPGALDALGAERVMVVTDQGIVKAGLYEKVRKVLEDAGKTVILEDEVKPDPSIQLVDTIAGKARMARVDALIGLGGGSSIDSAKVAAALVKNEGSIRQYLGVGLLPRPGLPIVAVPTTAGTGSETTYLSILSDLEQETKKGFGSPFIMPRYAFLDPSLTVGLPPHITAPTGMDALCHCLEAYTSANANPFSDPLAIKAIEMIGANIREAYHNGKSIPARQNMLLASFMAGIAFANAGVHAVHAFAYPLGGMFHVPHGMANSLMLPVIIKYTAQAMPDRFGHAARLLTGRKEADWKDCITEVEKLSSDLNLPRNLKTIDIPEQAVEDMSVSVMDQTRLLVNCPRPVTQADARAIYAEAWSR